MPRTGPVLTQKKRLRETLKKIFNINQFKQPSSKHFFGVILVSLNRPIVNSTWKNAMFEVQIYPTDSVFISRKVAFYLASQSKEKMMILNNNELPQNTSLN